MANDPCCDRAWLVPPGEDIDAFLAMTRDERIAAGFRVMHKEDCDG